MQISSLTFLAVSVGENGEPGRERRSFAAAHFLPPAICPGRGRARARLAGSPTGYPALSSGLGGDVTSSSEGLLLSPLPSRLEGGTEVLLKLNKANVIYLRYMVM